MHGIIVLADERAGFNRSAAKIRAFRQPAPISLWFLDRENHERTGKDEIEDWFYGST